MIALLLALLCGTANALEIKAPSPNSGTITPAAITSSGRITAPDATLTYGLSAATAAFSSGITASSVTAGLVGVRNASVNSGKAFGAYYSGIGATPYGEWGINAGGADYCNGTWSNGTAVGIFCPNGGASFGSYAAANTNAPANALIVDKVGIGTAAPESANKLQVQAASGNVVVASSTTASGFGVFSAHGASGGCIMLTDTDNAGWTKCKALNGTLSCATDADGICD